MSELLKIQKYNNQDVVSSLTISEKVSLSHEAVVRSIKKHLSHLEEFGKVGFEIRALESGQNTNTYYLNEDQSTLLLTCMKNTDIVMSFKKELVKAFSSLKKAALESLKYDSIGLEKEFSLLSMTADMLKVNDNSRLQMVHKFYESHSLNTDLLPNYTESKGVLLSATELLKRNNVGVSVRAFNKKALALEILEERERPSTTKGTKKYKALTEDGLNYGENQVNPNSPQEVQPLYFEGIFMKLIEELGL
ncbi:MAG: Rha family transcriptional regulator [Desulfobulbaceae bacterium]|nr:Rha family transcriptional regulator [Desulfobulbaceae bacterium]